MTTKKTEKKIEGKPKKILLTPAIVRDIKRIKNLLDGESTYKKLVEDAKKTATLYIKGGLEIEGYHLSAKPGNWKFKTSVTLKSLHTAFKKIIPLQSDYVDLKSVAIFKKYCEGSKVHMEKLEKLIERGDGESKCTKIK